MTEEELFDTLLACNDKHDPDTLGKLLSLSLDDKIKLTQVRIIEFYRYYDGMVYVSFSGGKDSTVLKHIADSLYNDIPSVFVNTGLEYPEIQRFVSEVASGKYSCFNADVTTVRPEKRFDQVIKEYGYPIVTKDVSTRIEYARKGKQWAINALKGLDRDGNEDSFKKTYMKWAGMVDAPFDTSPRCCSVMKKRPAKIYEKNNKRHPIIGTMVTESLQRTRAWYKSGCNSFESERPKSSPMSFWTEQDVLEYIRRFNLPYASVYGDIVEDNGVLKTTGCDRTGCMFCMFGCHAKSDTRFVRMKETHPNQYNYCMKSVNDGGLGLKDIIDWMNENVGTNIHY